MECTHSAGVALGVALSELHSLGAAFGSRAALTTSVTTRSAKFRPLADVAAWLSCSCTRARRSRGAGAHARRAVQGPAMASGDAPPLLRRSLRADRQSSVHQRRRRVQSSTCSARLIELDFAAQAARERPLAAWRWASSSPPHAWAASRVARRQPLRSLIRRYERRWAARELRPELGVAQLGPSAW